MLQFTKSQLQKMNIQKAKEDFRAGSADSVQCHQPLWIKINELSKLTLKNLRQNPSQAQICLKSLKHGFYHALFGHNQRERNGIQQLCILEGDKENSQSPAASQSEASKKCSMEQIQWKNNQKQTISTTIEQIVIMLIRKHHPIIKNNHSPFRDTTNLQSKKNSQTQTSTPDNHCHIDQSICLASQEYCQNEQIHYCAKETGHEDTISSIEKHGLEKILELLKAERENNCKWKQRKQKCCQKIWQAYGLLMDLQKYKFQENYLYEKQDTARQKILKELNLKNSLNQKIIKRYQKKIDLQSSQKKIIKQRSLYSIQIKQEEEEDRKEASLDKGQSPCWGLTLSKGNDLKKTSKKVYTIRSKPKQIASSLSSTLDVNSQQLRQGQIKAKVESSFREARKYQSLGKNILNNIVFDPDNMLATSKRKWMLFKSNERNGMRRFEKAIQNNRLLLRVGGIRLSLQQCNFKTKITVDNA